MVCYIVILWCGTRVMLYYLSRLGDCCFFVFQGEDGIRDLVRSRGLGDLYKRQTWSPAPTSSRTSSRPAEWSGEQRRYRLAGAVSFTHLTLPTSESSVDSGGRRNLKQKKNGKHDKKE